MLRFETKQILFAMLDKATAIELLPRAVDSFKKYAAYKSLNVDEMLIEYCLDFMDTMGKR